MVQNNTLKLPDQDHYNPVEILQEHNMLTALDKNIIKFNKVCINPDLILIIYSSDIIG